MTKFLAAFLISTAFATPSLTLAHDHMSNDHASHAHQGASIRTDLGEGLYMIKGQGGNILFSTGEDGTFVIDTQLADTAAGNLALINEVSDTPVVFVLNTHYRQGHTGGNEIFVSNGATIIAHENVRSRLLTEVENGKREQTALPVITFSEAKTLYWNNQQIEITHLPNAHTDGDAMVRFPNANVIHTGGTLFSGQYPFIALEAGGTVSGTVAALKKISDISDADTQIVPGHGALSTKRDVEEAIEMLEESSSLIRAEMMEGHDLKDILDKNPLAPYDAKYSSHLVSTEKMTTQLFNDLMATDERAKRAVEGNKTLIDKAQDATQDAVAVTKDAAVATKEAAEDLASDAATVIKDLTDGNDETPEVNGSLMDKAQEVTQGAVAATKDAAVATKEAAEDLASDAVTAVKDLTNGDDEASETTEEETTEEQPMQNAE